jgi:hypothetical protein
MQRTYLLHVPAALEHPNGLVLNLGFPASSPSV